MELIYRIQYHPKVIRDDIPQLSLVAKKRIKTAIQDKLSSRPEMFGIPLRRSLKGMRKLRVGNYRIVFRIDQDSILIFAILDRSAVYQAIKHRM